MASHPTAPLDPIIRPSRLEIALKPEIPDARGRGVAAAIRTHLGLNVESVRTADLLTIDADLTSGDLQRVRHEFTDPVIQRSAAGRIEEHGPFDWTIVVGFKPGVTDNVGRTALGALGQILGRAMREDEAVRTATAYLLSGAELTRGDAERVARDLLANPLIETIEVASREEWQAGKPELRAPHAGANAPVSVARIDLSGSDEDLLRISNDGTLSLTLAEMRAVREYFRAQYDEDPKRRAAGLDARPTDVELEMIAQTWSEHCKHKIFSGTIHYKDETGRERTIKSLFKTYIKRTTDEIAKRVPWLVSVFHDNAGVIAFNERMDVVYKVETHNSPSALEPYGGAMTGIVGCNRDPLGTGMGAELLINVWGYCFASPFTPPAAVPYGVMHPRRLRDGVHKGVIDGGNQSGIPYGLGWEFYDQRYLAKPMVYCGTVGWLPKRLSDGRAAAEKEARPGDLIVMVGGRIGKDGIHGATFSSVELNKDSPTQAVQIGDPITQKKMSDFLIEARDLGLFNAITDNGAGGLSSSIGEMAGGPGGAEVDLKLAPLKYAGLEPWEIWLSEAQERMSLAVPPEMIGALKDLAARREVEVTVLGEFNRNGFITLKYGDETVGRIELKFLQNGYPEMVMNAEWKPPVFDTPNLPREGDLTQDLRDVLARLNIASKETKSRQYDHEVKARTVIKPFVGAKRDVPSDATIFLAEYGGREGIVLSYGFNSHYADLDAYHMITAIVDLAVRRILAVGGRLDFIAGLDNFCWPDPVESASTPDGRYKLAQLVRANEALYDICTAYNVPLISGKDSMKNDSTRGGKKISVPPSVLFSAIGKIDDIARAITMEAKAAGDLVYLLGVTRAELGASEYAHMLHERSRSQGTHKAASPLAADPMAPRAIGGAVPQVDPKETLPLYRALESAAREGLVRSLHAVGLGGLGAALALVAMGGELGLDVDLNKVPADGALSEAEKLFSESSGRFVATIAPERRAAFEQAMGVAGSAQVGVVTEASRIVIRGAEGNSIVSENIPDFKQNWKAPLTGL